MFTFVTREEYILILYHIVIYKVYITVLKYTKSSTNCMIYIYIINEIKRYPIEILCNKSEHLNST